MKRIFLMVIGVVLLSAGFAFAQDEVAVEAEVTEKKDIGITKVFSPRTIPAEALAYFDDILIDEFAAMARFNVIGYQFRLDTSSATQLIEKIQEYKQEEIMEGEEYKDEDLGIVIIPSSTLRELVSAFFVVIPTINSYDYSVSNYTVEYTDLQGRRQVDRKTSYTYTVGISVDFINADGDLLETYDRTSTGSAVGAQGSDATIQAEAYKAALDNSVSSLYFYIRNMEEFMLKTAVRGLLGGGKIILELGADMGVETGYEFVLRETYDYSGFTFTEDKGLVRVYQIGDAASMARVVWGRVDVGDQLIEAPMWGGRSGLYANAVLPIIGKVTNLSATVNSTTFTPDVDFALPVGIDLGVAFAREIGYANLTVSRLGIIIDKPFSFYLDLGWAYELFLGPISLVPELTVSGLMEMTSAQSGSDALKFRTVYGGAKLGLSFNIQFSQKSKLRISALGSAYYPVAGWFTYVQGETVEVTAPDTLTVNGNSVANGLAGVLKVNAQAGFEWITRF